MRKIHGKDRGLSKLQDVFKIIGYYCNNNRAENLFHNKQVLYVVNIIHEVLIYEELSAKCLYVSFLYSFCNFAVYEKDFCNDTGCTAAGLLCS